MGRTVEDVEKYLVRELLASLWGNQLPTSVWWYFPELWHVIALWQQEIVTERFRFNFASKLTMHMGVEQLEVLLHQEVGMLFA